MSYELHIERPSGEIPLEEWKQIIGGTKGLRLCSKDSVASNPKTGEDIHVPASSGDVEVLFATKGFFGFGAKTEWIKVFRWSNGAIHFKATTDIESSEDLTHQTAAALAKQLSASIVGDEGEEYSW